jgi:transcriptional regulator with XRE-family HTH domain
MDKVDTNQSKKITELARRIRRARVNAKLSQAELGKGIGLSDKSISAYEQGRSIPPFPKLKKIAEQTSHPLAYFTEDKPTEAVDLAQKLSAIERELAEVKRLLKKASE